MLEPRVADSFAAAKLSASKRHPGPNLCGFRWHSFGGSILVHLLFRGFLRDFLSGTEYSRGEKEDTAIVG